MKRSEELTFGDEDAVGRKKKLTSTVWETFSPLSSSGLRDGVIDSAKCHVCNKVFSTRHGTSSMMRHAKRHTEFPAAAVQPSVGGGGVVAAIAATSVVPSTTTGATRKGSARKNSASALLTASGRKSPAGKKAAESGLASSFDESGGAGVGTRFNSTG